MISLIGLTEGADDLQKKISQGTTAAFHTTMSKNLAAKSSNNLKRKRNTTDKKTGTKRKHTTEVEESRTGGIVKNADELAWKKISIENDEFDDFEEIEGVDVEYVEKDGNKMIQLKVFLCICSNGLLVGCGSRC